MDLFFLNVMKTRFILFCSALIFIVNIQCVIGQVSENFQDQYKGRFISDIELLIGTGLIYGSGSELLKDLRVPNFGLRTSLGLVHKATDNFHFAVFLSYADKGIKFKSYSEDPLTPPAIVKINQDILLKYLEFAVVPRYSFGNTRRLHAGVGPYFGYLVSNKLSQEVYRDEILVSRSASRLDPDLNYKNTDLGVLLTVGSSFAISDKLAATAQFHYALGLVDINKPQLDKMRNNVFSLQIGLVINRNR